VWLVALVAVLVGSVLSWFMIYSLAASKSALNSEINRLTIHWRTSVMLIPAWLVFPVIRTIYLTVSAIARKSQFSNVNNAISDANKQISQTKTNLTAITTQVNSLQTQTSHITDSNWNTANSK